MNILFWIGIVVIVLSLSVLITWFVDLLEIICLKIDPVKEYIYPIHSDKFICVSVSSLKDDPNLSKYYYRLINPEDTLELYEALENKYNAQVINLLTDSNGYRFFVMRKNR